MLRSNMTESLRRARGASRILIFTVFLFLSPAPRSGLAQQADGHATFSLISGAFRAKGYIPSRYTCSGEDVSPSLRWSSPPAGTRSFALTVTDPDAPGQTWVHWVAFNLPPGERGLPAGIPEGDQIQEGGVQGSNDFHRVGYGGPCPPPGKPHRYLFRLYALDTRLALKPGAARAEVERAMKGHILGRAELIGLYGR